MNTVELRQLTRKKQIELLTKTRRELASEKFRAQTGQNQNTAALVRKRKMIAQILTLLNEQPIETATK